MALEPSLSGLGTGGTKQEWPQCVTCHGSLPSPPRLQWPFHQYAARPAPSSRRSLLQPLDTCTLRRRQHLGQIRRRGDPSINKKCNPRQPCCCCLPELTCTQTDAVAARLRLARRADCLLLLLLPCQTRGPQPSAGDCSFFVGLSHKGLMIATSGGIWYLIRAEAAQTAGPVRAGGEGPDSRPPPRPPDSTQTHARQLSTASASHSHSLGTLEMIELPPVFLLNYSDSRKRVLKQMF